MGFFTSFFSGKTGNTAGDKQKSDQKNFDIFKYDGMRAQRMGRHDYAIRCFNEALAIMEDFETRSYLAQSYQQTNALDEARAQLERMASLEPEHTGTLLALANVCYMLEDYPAMAEAAQKAIDREEEGNAPAYYLLGKATHKQGDLIMAIAHLTKAVALKDDYTEARLLRAEILAGMGQYAEATQDIEAILATNPESEEALLLRGKVREACGQAEAAEQDYRAIIEANPFNEQAYLQLGMLYIAQQKPAEAIAVLDEAIEQNPGCAQAYHERGRARLMQGDKEGSTEDMKKSLELAPDEAKSFNGEYRTQQLGNTGDILGL